MLHNANYVIEKRCLPDITGTHYCVIRPTMRQNGKGGNSGTEDSDDDSWTTDTSSTERTAISSTRNTTRRQSESTVNDVIQNIITNLEIPSEAEEVIAPQPFPWTGDIKVF